MDHRKWIWICIHVYIYIYIHTYDSIHLRSNRSDIEIPDINHGNFLGMAYNAFRIVLECRPDQSLTHRDGHVCWTCHTSAPKCPLCCEGFRQKVVLIKKPSLHNSWSWKCVLTLRMVGNEKAFFSAKFGRNPSFTTKYNPRWFQEIARICTS